MADKPPDVSLVKLINEDTHLTGEVRFMNPSYSAAVQAVAGARSTEAVERTKQRWISLIAGIPIVGLIAWRHELAVPMLIALALMTDGNPIGIIREWVRHRKDLPALPGAGDEEKDREKK